MIHWHWKHDMKKRVNPVLHLRKTSSRNRVFPTISIFLPLSSLLGLSIGCNLSNNDDAGAEAIVNNSFQMNLNSEIKRVTAYVKVSELDFMRHIDSTLGRSFFIEHASLPSTPACTPALPPSCCARSSLHSLCTTSTSIGISIGISIGFYSQKIWRWHKRIPKRYGADIIKESKKPVVKTCWILHTHSYATTSTQQKDTKRYAPRKRQLAHQI